MQESARSGTTRGPQHFLRIDVKHAVHDERRAGLARDREPLNQGPPEVRYAHQAVELGKYSGAEGQYEGGRAGGKWAKSVQY